jgi:hypothetical protein
MVIEYHPKYMRRLAEIYLQRYGMLGQAEAGKWYNQALSPEIRSRLKPYIRQVAEERDLEVT